MSTDQNDKKNPLSTSYSFDGKTIISFLAIIGGAIIPIAIFIAQFYKLKDDIQSDKDSFDKIDKKVSIVIRKQDSLDVRLVELISYLKGAKVITTPLK